MEITPKENIKSLKFPLPIYSIIHIADAVSRDGKEFSIVVGLDKDMIAQLKELSLDDNDVDLQKNTGDKKRFGEGSYEDWYKKGRIPFILVHKNTNALAALIWFGAKPLGKKSIKFGEGSEIVNKEKDWHTLALRSYPPYRGKGLMKDFAKFTIDFYEKKFPNAKLWEGMDSRNNAIIKLNTELGFTTNEASSDRESNWLIMVK